MNDFEKGFFYSEATRDGGDSLNSLTSFVLGGVVVFFSLAVINAIIMKFFGLTNLEVLSLYKGIVFISLWDTPIFYDVAASVHWLKVLFILGSAGVLMLTVGYGAVLCDEMYDERGYKRFLYYLSKPLFLFMSVNLVIIVVRLIYHGFLTLNWLLS